MSVSDGQDVNAAVTNAAFLSRKVDSDTIGKVGLKNTDTESGNPIDNIQQYTNEIADADGTNGEGDASRKIYATNNIIADGDSRKQALEKFDVAVQDDITNLAAHIPSTNDVHGVSAAEGDIMGTDKVQNVTNKTFTDSTAFNDTTNATSKDTGAIVTEGGVGIEQDIWVGGNARVEGDLIVDGDQNILGDVNIIDPTYTANDTGNQATADAAGAGLRISMTDAVSGSVAFDSTLPSLWKIGREGSEVEVVNVSSSQTLTNKDLSSGTNTFPDLPIAGDVTGTLSASTVARLQGSDLPAPTAGDNGKAIIYNDGTGDFEYGEAGGGSGGAGENFSTNPTLDTDVSGYATYTDNTDLDGGAANITFAHNTTNPLQGAGDGLLTKDAADRSTEGFREEVSLPDATNYQVITISFDYLGSAGLADDDLKVVAYDVTNSELMQVVSGQFIKTSSVPGKHYAQIQTKDTATIRYGVEIASTSAVAYTVQFDNFSIGRLAVARGAVITDWVDNGPITVTGTTSNPTKGGGIAVDSFRTRRVGDSLECRVSYRQDTGGTTGSGDYLLQLPSGFSIDTSKVSPDSGIEGAGTFTLDNIVGKASIGATSPFNANLEGAVSVYDANNVRISGTYVDSAGNSFLGVWGGAFFEFSQAGYFVNAVFRVPIQGWSSNTEQSTDLGGRVISALVERAAPQTIATGLGAIVEFDTVIRDSISAYDLINDYYLINEAGDYQVSGSVRFTGNASGIRTVTAIVNGTDRYILDGIGTPGSSAVSMGGSILLPLEKGDQVQLECFQNSGGNLDLQIPVSQVSNFMSIHKVQSPQTLAGNELVAFKASTDSGQSIPNSTATTVVFEDVSYDTHNAWNPLTGEYTCPLPGKYRTTTVATLGNSTTWSGTEVFRLDIRLFGKATDSPDNSYPNNSSGGSIAASVNGSTTFDCEKGDIIEVRLDQRSGASLNLLSSGQFNYVTIEKVE